MGPQRTPSLLRAAAPPPAVPGDPPGNARGSAMIFVRYRCASEMRSTSIATASTACSIRSSRFSTLAESPGATDGRSTNRRVNALITGMPSAMTAIVMKNDWMISTASWGMNPGGNGPIGPCRMYANTLGITCPVAVHRKHESNRRTASGRALGRHRTTMREHRLARDREPESCPPGFGSHVRLPDPAEMLFRYAATAVGDSDLHARRGAGTIPIRVRPIAFVGNSAERPHTHRDLRGPPTRYGPA